METLILGIDDAGRGPIIGPMVLAGVLCTEKQEQDLKLEGVKRKEILQKFIENKGEIIHEISN